MKKRWVAGALAAAVLLLGVAGCGGNADDRVIPVPQAQEFVKAMEELDHKVEEEPLEEGDGLRASYTSTSGKDGAWHLTFMVFQSEKLATAAYGNLAGMMEYAKDNYDSLSNDQGENYEYCLAEDAKVYYLVYRKEDTMLVLNAKWEHREEALAIREALGY